MRYIVMCYCLLTLLFTGGCLLEPSATDWNDFHATPLFFMLVLATVANAAFAAMLWRGGQSCRPLVVLGSLYTLVQAFLVWRGLWSDLGEMTVLVFAVIALKGAMVVFAGMSEQWGEE